MLKKNCRLCSSKNLKLFLDLGHQPPSDQFIKLEKTDQQTLFYPLKVMTCMKCGFKQLNYVVDPKILYQDDYPYESSMTKAGSIHFDKFADSVDKEFKFKKGSRVLDIGSNVGVLLSAFKKRNYNVLGIDPAKNITNIANKRGIRTINGFFDHKFAEKIRKKNERFKIITATNVFAHIDNLRELMINIKKVLDKKGIFIIEAPHFLNLVKNLEYDTVYHEHLSYITVKPLISFFKKFNLKIIKILNSDIHGGSIRMYICREKDYKIQNSVQKTLRDEKINKLNNFKSLIKFANRVSKNRYDILDFIIKCKKNKKKVVALSAPAKGMTLLNFLRLDNHFLEYVTEKSNLKIGKYTPGTNLKVHSDNFLVKTMPDYALILAWNFKSEIIKNNIEYLNKGGKFLIPIPKLTIVSKKNFRK